MHALILNYEAPIWRHQISPTWLDKLAVMLDKLSVIQLQNPVSSICYRQHLQSYNSPYVWRNWGPFHGCQPAWLFRSSPLLEVSRSCISSHQTFNFWDQERWCLVPTLQACTYTSELTQFGLSDGSTVLQDKVIPYWWLWYCHITSEGSFHSSSGPYLEPQVLITGTTCTW